MKLDQNAENALPKGWAEYSIDQVTLPVSKIDPKEHPDRRIDYIDIACIDNSRQFIGKVKQYQLKDAPSRARQIVRSGDVLFATVRPYLRNIASVPRHYDQQIASTGFSALRPAANISPAFLFHKVISRDFVNGIARMQYGVSYSAVSDEQVREQVLWLPPLREQHRIVAKIEELFSELDKGIESLKTARTKLDVYRQAVLKHAFEGKLTAWWRDENQDKLETPEQLLARIKQEREALYKQQLREWKTAAKKWDGGGMRSKRIAKPKSAKDLSSIGQKDQEPPPDLPNGWVWVKLGQLFSISPQNGVYKPASEYGDGTHIIRIDDFYDGQLIRRNGFKKLRLNHQEIEKYKVRNSDLIINRVNSIEHLGKCALVEGLTENTVFESNIMRCRVIDDVISKAYVATYLASHEGRNRLCKNAKHAINQASINQTDVTNALVPTTSLEEQLLIVQKIRLKLSQAGALISQIEALLKQAGVLRQSILKKAFSGQLVSQDPNDEPASVLLERIRADREKAAKNSRPRKAKIKKDLRKNTDPIASKVWSFCTALCDDGVSMATTWRGSPV